MERLLLLLVGTEFNRGDISWGGAWAQYSLTCMLQDILTGLSRHRRANLLSLVASVLLNTTTDMHARVIEAARVVR